MDPMLKSIITTLATGLATSAATWAATVGIIPASSESTVINGLVSLALYGIAAVLVWYKALDHTKEAQIAAVNNADNGVKVVAKTAPAIQVDAPLK